jgi:ABC-type nitrate/sulfonate/bicarbonate transport system substrate-binding protein
VAAQHGAVQASVFAGAEVARAEAHGFVSLLRMEDVAPLPEAGVTTTLAKLESRRAEVRGVLRAMVRALQYLKADREGSLPAFMEFLHLSREEAELAYERIAYAHSDDGTLSEQRLRYTIETEKQMVDLVEDVSFDRVADFGPLYEALNELGITPPPGSAR